MGVGDRYREEGNLAEMGALGVGRNEPTGCDSIIEVHEAESFRIPDSFKVVLMGSPHSPATIQRQQLAQVHRENEQSSISHPVYHPTVPYTHLTLPTKTITSHAIFA